MKVAAIQHDIVWEDRGATLARLAPMVARAAGEGARLIVLPEMFAVGFSMATERVAEAPGGPTTRWLVDMAGTHGVWIGGSLPELGAGDEQPANQFVLASPDGAVHRYAKIHPFSHAGEERHYRAGSTRVSVAVDGLRVSLSVCYDLRFADGYWAQAPGTDLYLVVANWPASRRHHWRSLLVARAIENQAYVAGVNRVGSGGGVAYAGDSCVVDPLGEVVARAGDGDGEAIVSADVDRATVARVRQAFPFLADRRT